MQRKIFQRSFNVKHRNVEFSESSEIHLIESYIAKIQRQTPNFQMQSRKRIFQKSFESFEFT